MSRKHNYFSASGNIFFASAEPIRASHAGRRDGAGVDEAAEDVENLLREGFLRGVVDEALEGVEVVGTVEVVIYICSEAA